MKMQQAPSTLTAAALEAIENTDPSPPPQPEINNAKICSNSSNKENPAQPSPHLKQKSSSKKKNDSFTDENSASLALVSAFGSASAAPGGAFSQSTNETGLKTNALSAQAFQNITTSSTKTTKTLFGDATAATTNIPPSACP